MKLLSVVVIICLISLTACTSNEPSIEPNPSQVSPTHTKTPSTSETEKENEKQERTVIKVELIDEENFVGNQMAWIKMINQDITAINEQDVETASTLRGVSPDPSVMITGPIKSVKFIEVEQSTDVSGAIRVDYRFNDNPSEPQYALYSFEKKGNGWVIVDWTVDTSYRPGPSEMINPQLINESEYSGEQLEWVKVINQDIKAIAIGDEEAYDKLRNSKQSMQADIPPLPVVSIELIKVVDQRDDIVILQVDRRKWGEEDVETFTNYILGKENGTWFIRDID
ncbi:hypothetical protein ACX1C1_09010 [Paenibacillus sp. strain BS8-2]